MSIHRRRGRGGLPLASNRYGSTVAEAAPVAAPVAGQAPAGRATVAATAHGATVATSPGREIQLGYDYTQHWPDAGNTALNAVPIHNVHLVGFGQLELMTSEGGSKVWTSVDNRMAQAASHTPDKLVLTACSAPGFMKDGGDVWNMEKRVLAEYHQAYANLVAEACTRYNGTGGQPNITHLMVWNEMKGYWNVAQNRWDYEGYTDLYNKVWTTVKAVRPDLLIGGPYSILTTYPNTSFSHPPTDPKWVNTSKWGAVDQRSIDCIDYWFANCTGHDFFCFDGGLDVMPSGTPPPGTWVSAADKFAVLAQHVAGYSNKPIWMAETYVATGGGQSWATGLTQWQASVNAMRDACSNDLAFLHWRTDWGNSPQAETTSNQPYADANIIELAAWFDSL